MVHNILIAYASKHNATKEIAERIGFTLSSGNLNITIASVEKVADVTQFTVVILGSAVYFGQWRMSATKFIKDNKSELLQKKVWIFSSGPLGRRPVYKLTKYWDFDASLNDLFLSVNPISIVTFHGAINKSRLNFLENEVLKQIRIPLRDYRQWDHIQAWAQTINGHLTKSSNQLKIEKFA
jgi:menaquinone-dependent protoporphyrinogen oxidase